MARYQNEDLLKQIQMVAKEIGKSPTMVDFDSDPRVASSNAVIRRFGSWNNALRSAGLSTYNDRITTTKDGLIEQLHLLTKEIGRVPTARDFDKSKKTFSTYMVYKFFDSWNAFLIEGGYKPRKSSTRKITNKELIEQVQNLAAKLGRNPDSVEFNLDEDTVSSTTVFNRFGSWRQFLYCAGLIDKP